jgi:plastocyanin
VLAAAIVILAAACEASGGVDTSPGSPMGAGSPALIPSFETAGATVPSLAPVPSASPASSAPPASSDLPSPEASDVVSPAGALVDPRADGLDIGVGESTITLEAAVIRPGPVTLIVHNGGSRTHSLEMQRHGGSGRSRSKIETRSFGPGETLRIEADLAPGRYELEDSSSDHGSSELRTWLEVRNDAPLLAASLASGSGHVVRIVQYAMVPARIEVAAGSTVTWRNDDPEPQTITADDGTFDSRQMDPGDSFSVVFGSRGVFPYHSDIHPTLAGTIVVH